MRDSPNAPIPALSAPELAAIAPSPSPAKALAVQAAGGDIAATRRLLEAVAPRMKRAVMAVMGAGNSDVDDVLQQSLIGLVQALPSYRGECEPSYFGARIAVRTAMASRKRARAAWARHDDEASAEALPSNDAAPLTVAVEERRRRIVRELLETISEEQAETMAMRFMLGWSLEEVAQATRVPLNTVRSRLRLAKEALRKRIQADPVLVEELEVEP
jgi:RNA polymerase sigma-70 factor (ECF subfamily)